MKFTLKIWRQKNADSKGKIKIYRVEGIEGDMSQKQEKKNKKIKNKYHGQRPL